MRVTLAGMTALRLAYLANVLILLPIAIPTLLRLFETAQGRFDESAGWRILVGALWTGILVLSLLGRVDLAVTTNLTCNFLRRPKPVDLIGDGRILKLGKRLAVGEVLLYSDGETEPVAHVTCTYSLPLK